MSDNSARPRGNTLLGWGAALLVLLLLTCAGFYVPAQLLLTLAVGWVKHLGRTVPQVSVSGAGVATACIAILGATVLLHGLARWFVRAANRSEEPERGDDAGRLLTVAVEGRELKEAAWPIRRTLSIMGAVLLLFVAGLSGTAIAHQIVWLVRSPEPLTEGSMSEIAYRSQSRNNLKQIGLALHNYHDTYRVLPMGGVHDERGRPRHGWMTSILPFVESSPLYSNFDMNRPWDHPANAGLFTHVLPVYQVPGVEPKRIGEGRFAPGAAHYSANSHLFGANRGTPFPEITDGLSNTLLAGEAAGNFKAWGDPTNVRDPVLGINETPDGFGGPWKGGAHFLMGDGAVRFINEEIDPAVLKALSTPRAGDRVGEF